MSWGADARAADYRITPTPAWVTPITTASRAVVPVGQISSGAYFLLGDFQTRSGPEGRTVFRHLAAQALNDKGVDAIANIELLFEPSHQTLHLHMLAVIRDGQRIDKLRRATIRVLQREKELEYRIYDGRKSAHIFLDDIRTGDIVEYAYSVLGSNPVFGTREFGSQSLQWAVPMERLHVRLLLPADRDMRIAVRNSARQPLVRMIGSHREYVWDESPLAPLALELDAPGWFDPYPALEWSEFADWNAVARWAVPLYRPPAQLGPSLRAKVLSIEQGARSQADKVLAALRLVQGDVRYLGVEIGTGSFVPSPPDRVYDQRFGDCKDKTLLLLSLLHHMGIDAQAALVNTVLTRGISDTSPNPAAFNHVLAHVKIGGRSYWLDPTRAPQPGSLEVVHQPDFGRALLVSDATRELLPMQRDPAPALKRRIDAQFDARNGFDQPARLTVTTTSEGREAEEARNLLATTSPDALQKQYLNYYARYYAGLRVAQAMAISDDTGHNRITVSEYYEIPDFWPLAEDGSRREASFYSPEVMDLLRLPSSTVRHSPVALAPPLDVTLVTEVLLPESWPIKAETTRIDDAHFTLERRIGGDDRRLILTDHFRSHVDHVKMDAIPSYVANLERARNALGYRLFHHMNLPPATLAERFNWMIALLAAMLTGALVWLAVRLYRYDPPPGNFTPIPALTGLRGWLLLPALNLFLLPFRLVSDFLPSINVYAVPTWIRLTHPGGAGYDPLWAPALLFELVATLTLGTLALLTLVLFLKRRSSTPRVFIALSIGIVISQSINQALVMALPLTGDVADTLRNPAELIQSVLFLAVWGTYFLRSQRVKSTFTRTWRPRPPEPLPATAPLEATQAQPAG
ncbi:DUF3857 domain-containing protein [Methyloversatilis sp.]|uniref:DUF3857 domain-containing protein n=1 Tax=Methyloversatilis sp. TaxID=2569862 RepID=UPI0027322EC7|nr:DUF3857 domain-containing protein [Methyloversatilis sp.]MDP2870215.1 DUF3857 domain-containing protein [Methyloversatilis sp.]MDP3456329.1 DUF3857 domain-containing protein [Methyloversatilis sp.]MDP3579463.1 DUF3857 domain-containing protein [Methyloversatilis sp.]